MILILQNKIRFLISHVHSAIRYPPEMHNENFLHSEHHYQQLHLRQVVVAAVASADSWATGAKATAASGFRPLLSHGEGASKDIIPGSGLLFKLPPPTIEEKAGGEAEGAGKEEKVQGVIVAAEEGRPFKGGGEIDHDSERTPANRFHEGKQFQGQVNRFSSGSQGGNGPVTSVVGSDPLAAVSMIQSYVDEVISKPTGERPGYIMINSRNPVIINQLVAALTQRFGPSSVHQDAQTIQNIVGNSVGLGSSGTQATNSDGNRNTIPVFPFSNRFEKTSTEGVTEAKNGLSEVEYIRQQLASIADLSISTGILVNDTMDAQGRHGQEKISPSTPKTPVIVLNHLNNSEDNPQSDIQNAILSENGEYTKPQSISEEIETIEEVDKILANHLRESVSVNHLQSTENDNSDLSSNEVSLSSSPHFAGITPEASATPHDNPNDYVTSLKYLTTETSTLATKSMPDIHHKTEQYMQQPETTKHGDLSENEVLPTGYEDYYEDIDGELVLSPSKFMRRGGPFSPSENKEDFGDNTETRNGDNSEENIVTDGVKADLSGFKDPYDEIGKQQYNKWAMNYTDSQVYPLGELQDQPNHVSSLGVSPVNPQVMEALKGMEKEDLQTLGLAEKLEMIPVLEETPGNTRMKIPMLEQLPKQVLNHLLAMNTHDLQTLNLLDGLRQLYHTQNESGSWHHNNTNDVEANKRLSPVIGALATNHEERQQHRPNFSAANFRQSDAPVQNIPPNFFPNRPSPSQHQQQHPAPAPQLSPEQQQIISRLPAGMQDVVSSIVMAVQAPATSAPTTQTPPYLPLPYPYPYPPYPYYPPPNFHQQQVPATQQPHTHNGGGQAHHSGHGAHSHHSAHGSHTGQGAHDGHSNHGGHDSHTGHGAHDNHNNHENHGGHTGHGAHGNDNHGGHGSHHGHNVNSIHGSHSGHDTTAGQTNDRTTEAHGSGSNTSLIPHRTQPLATSTPGNGTPRPAVVSEPIFSETSDTQNVAGETSPNSSVLASRVGELAASGIRDNDNSGHGTVGLLCRNEGTSGFCENRLSVGGVPNRPDRNQGLLQLRQDPAQMGNGRPSGGGIVNYRPPQQSSMQMGGPVINVVLPEVQESPLSVEEEEIGPLIGDAPPEPASDSAPEMMDREEMNSLLQSLFSSPTLLLLGIIFATSAAYMAIAMEEQAAQQRFQQAQLAAAFGGQQQFFQGRRRRQLPDVWYPKKPRFEKQNNR